MHCFTQPILRWLQAWKKAQSSSAIARIRDKVGVIARTEALLVRETPPLTKSSCLVMGAPDSRLPKSFMDNTDLASRTRRLKHVANTSRHEFDTSTPCPWAEQGEVGYQGSSLPSSYEHEETRVQLRPRNRTVDSGQLIISPRLIESSPLACPHLTPHPSAKHRL